MLYMFRTILVHLQDQLYKLYITFGICHTTATRMVPAYTKCDVQLIKLLLKMDWYSPKHIEHLVENSLITIILCILLVYIQTERWCTDHTMSNFSAICQIWLQYNSIDTFVVYVYFMKGVSVLWVRHTGIKIRQTLQFTSVMLWNTYSKTKLS